MIESVADITYIRIVAAFVYLTVILDLYSRKAIGYAISRSIDTDLSLAAFQMAIETRNPRAGLIHHSDQGVQYAAHDYVDVLKNHEINISMSRKGNPYDNAFAESFMKTIKNRGGLSLGIPHSGRCSETNSLFHRGRV